MAWLWIALFAAFCAVIVGYVYVAEYRGVEDDDEVVPVAAEESLQSDLRR